MSYFLFIVTVPNLEEGKKIGRVLVEEKLAACANIVKDIFSIYEWKDKIMEDTEHLMFIKTTEENSDKIIQKIEEIHSYDTPEIIGLKIEKGSQKYLNWIKDVVE